MMAITRRREGIVALQRSALLAVILLVCSVCGHAANRPDLLLILTDDQSWAHTGMEAYPSVKTPNFDTLARQGIYFRQGFVSAPTCTASRSAILSGQDFWRSGSGAVLHGTYPWELISYQEILQQHGYRTGFTGKAWGPGYQYDRGTLTGEQFNTIQKKTVPEGISPTDYAANLDAFLSSQPAGQPFSFWVGIQEPHRRRTAFSTDGYAANDGNYFATAEQKRAFPDVLPDTLFARQDFQGYLQQIEQLDGEVGHIIDVLRQHGRLDNTLIVFTSDNGMPFPGGKSNNSYYGVKVPFAVRWGQGIRQPHIDSSTLVSTIDIAPTFLQAAGVPVPPAMTGVSFLPLLVGKPAPTARQGYVVTGYERHTPEARPEHGTYPSRAIVTGQYMYIRNFLPDRWPFGDPPDFADGQSYLLWKDVTDPAEVEWRKTWLLGKRPAEMLFDIQADPFQKTNLIATTAGMQKFRNTVEPLRLALQAYLARTGDPVLKNPRYFEAMPITR
ncbi:MAG TPA: sulfatase [Pseudomonadales bacterium]|nr:sulfatase [Pseudomonadales bacterium]